MPDELVSLISFLPVSEENFEELVQLRIAAMRESLERVGRFHPERARERLRKTFFPEHTRFIAVDGERVGFYTFRPVEDALHLDHFYIHPQWQSRGIGSYVMKKLTTDADDRGWAIHLGALRESAANRFYQRHGFAVERVEEWDIYYARPPLEKIR